MKIDSSYLRETFDAKKVRIIVRAMTKMVKDSNVEFDTVVFRGMSGALIAPILAYRLKKYVAVCRKESDGSHSGHSGKLEGNVDIKNFIIIDDFIDMGTTVEIILKTVKDCSPSSKCVGIFLYRSSSYGERFDCRGVKIPVFRHFLNSDGKTSHIQMPKCGA
jgi:orotate phosphoribosyltransferase-like protein